MSEDAHQVEVVVAEDSSMQARMLSKRLMEAGFDVRVGRNGQEALDLIRERPPQIIISDIEMPKMNGFELCGTVKTDPIFREVERIRLLSIVRVERGNMTCTVAVAAPPFPSFTVTS